MKNKTIGNILDMHAGVESKPKGCGKEFHKPKPKISGGMDFCFFTCGVRNRLGKIIFCQKCEKQKGTAEVQER